LGVNKGLFTNGCKKVLKLVQNVILKKQYRKAQEEELRDIFVINVAVGLAQKEDLISYKKLSSKSMFIGDKF
jgi:hypothetical protein